MHVGVMVLRESGTAECGAGTDGLGQERMWLCVEVRQTERESVCGQNVELLNVKLAVHIVTIGLQRVKSLL